MFLIQRHGLVWSWFGVAVEVRLLLETSCVASCRRFVRTTRVEGFLVGPALDWRAQADPKIMAE